MDKVGFIGLGAMGTPMAWNVRRHGYPLGVYNRSPGPLEPFRNAGVEVCDSPRSVAGRADIVIIMVTGPEALQAIMEGPDGVAAGITAGKVVVNMSTVSPEATLAAQTAVEAKGAAFVDAPVSGSVQPAEEGSLVILAGGDPKVIQRITPLLKAMGKAVVACGAVGQGTRMKLVLNLLLGTLMEGLAETMMLARGFGLDQAKLLEALGAGPLAAPIFQPKAKAILEGSYAGQFPVALMFKDLNLVLDAAGRSRIPLPQAAATRECFASAMARGLGEEDIAAVIKVLESLTSKTVRS